jgi:hemerythrin
MNNQNDKIREMAKVVSNEHHEIENLIEQIDAMIMRHEANIDGVSIIGKIADLCVDHIHKEECLMEAIKYSMIKEHAADHCRIFETITRSLEDCEWFSDLEWTAFARSIREAFYNHVAHFDDQLFDELRYR